MFRQISIWWKLNRLQEDHSSSSATSYYASLRVDTKKFEIFIRFFFTKITYERALAEKASRRSPSPSITVCEIGFLNASVTENRKNRFAVNTIQFYRKQKIKNSSNFSFYQFWIFKFFIDVDPKLESEWQQNIFTVLRQKFATKKDSKKIFLNTEVAKNFLDVPNWP